ncbi:GrpB family protein [Streptomyces sparsus]
MTETPDGVAGAMTEQEIRAAHVGEVRPQRGEVTLSPYDPGWPARFDEFAGRVRAALGSTVTTLEHVGSTSVPGLAAKPVIDMLLVVPDPSDERSYVPALTAVGFVLSIREPDWYEHRVLKLHDVPASRHLANLHVFPDRCPETARMLRFRDRLRSDEADRELYARTKRELATRQWTYLQQYADAKSAVVEEILGRSASRPAGA